MTSRREILKGLPLVSALRGPHAWMVVSPCTDADPEKQAEAMANAVCAAFPGHGITTAEWETLRRHFRLMLLFGERLRTLELGNMDEPATAFSVAEPRP